MSSLEESIERLKEWKHERRHQWTDLFRSDLEAVLDAASKMIAGTSGTLSAAATTAWRTATAQNTCACHERDSSFVCDFCRSQGYKGHMQAEVAK